MPLWLPLDAHAMSDAWPCHSGTLKDIWQSEGVHGFFKGNVATMAKVVPQMAIQLAVRLLFPLKNAQAISNRCVIPLAGRRCTSSACCVRTVFLHAEVLSLWACNVGEYDPTYGVNGCWTCLSRTLIMGNPVLQSRRRRLLGNGVLPFASAWLLRAHGPKSACIPCTCCLFTPCCLAGLRFCEGRHACQG